MKVFLSWSGERSRKLAAELYWFLPRVIQAADPWMSTADIYMGVRWTSVLSETLKEVTFGIICLTEENASSPWLMFEAGAISNRFGDAYVCPYFLGEGSAGIPAALSQFQAGDITEQGTRRLVTSLNNALQSSGECAIRPDVLDDTFNRWWSEMQSRLEKISGEPSKPDELLGENRTIFLGWGRKALNQVLARTEAAHVIRNSFVTFNIGPHESYLEHQFEAIAQAMNACLERGDEWRDILSPNLRQAMQCSVLKQKYPRNYAARLIRVAYPVINVLLLEKVDPKQKDEVVFGWGHFLKVQDDPVFLSNDPHLVLGFKNYWEALWDDAEEFHDPDGPLLFPADIQGVWARFATGKAASGESFDDLAVVKIEAVDAGRSMRISGYRYRNCDFQNEQCFVSVSSSFDGSRLWFVATRHANAVEEYENPYIATGHYDFRRKENGQLDFVGAFVDVEPGEPPFNGDRLQILCGRRVIGSGVDIDLGGDEMAGIVQTRVPDSIARREWVPRLRKAFASVLAAPATTPHS